MKVLNRFTNCLLLFVMGTAPLMAQRVNERSGPAPSFEGTDILSAETVRLEDYRGRLLLLNFWATWCSACIMELPALIDLRDDFADDLQVIGIALDYSEDTVEGYLLDEGVDYPVILSTDKIERDYGGINTTPTTFLIDTDGQIVETIIGYRPYDVLAEVIEGYLE